jgi:polyhydroxyalkanoate synthesis regulator phasin
MTEIDHDGRKLVDRKTKIGAGVAGALALAAGVGAAGAVAAQRALDAREESQAVIDDAADQLGVEPSELSDALKEALKNRVDEAVEEGRLTEEQGRELKERIDAGETPLVFPGFGRHGGFGLGHGQFGKLDTAAEYLGLTEEQLGDRLRKGETLAEIARAEGKSVDGLVDALDAKANEKIDKAVEKNRLTEEQATQLKKDLEQRTQDLVQGELPEGRLHPGFGFFGPGFGFHGRPGALPGEPHSGGPRA